MKKLLINICLAFAICTGAVAQTKAPLTPAEFSKQISEDQEAIVVDVRTPAEFQKGHLANALNINVSSDKFEEHLSAVDKNKPVYVYCLSGGRSAKAVAKMRALGYTNITEMEGGMLKWRANSLPEAKVDTTVKGMSQDDYQALLASDLPVLVDFYAEWCAPCREMKPYLEKIAKDMSGKIKVVRIDIDANRTLAKELNVTELPVLRLYKEGEQVWENVGMIDELSVRKQLE